MGAVVPMIDHFHWEHQLTHVIVKIIAEKCLECPQCYDKIYLFVPFKQKDIAKELGCKWDSDKKRWYFKWSEWTTNPETKEKAYKLLKMFGSPHVQMLLEKMY